MLTFVKGSVGSGKTLFTTRCAYITEKEQICSNYKLNLENNKDIIDFDVNLLFNDKLFKTLMILDEAYIYADSRHSMNIDNLLVSYVGFQQRKRDIDIMLTLQDFSTIDKRFKNIVDNIVLCKNNEIDECFEYTYVTRELSKTLTLSYKNAKKYFKMYDTNQLIFNKKINNLQYDISNCDKNILFEDNIEKFKSFILDYKDITIKKDLVKVFCIQEELPKKSDFIDSFYYFLIKKGIIIPSKK